ncbi:MAG TPA: cytochrome C oxidase subunit II [Candidatus Angelobacter sp.]
MRVALTIALLFIALGCAWLFVAHPWWFPAGVSAQAAALDHEFKVAFLLLGSLFIAGQIALAFFLLRSRRNGNALYHRGDWRFEIAWTLAIAALFFWFNVSGEKLWSRMMLHQPDADAVQIEVTGAQFQWYFRYSGADGVFGRTDAQKFARPEEGNPLGIDPADPVGHDDIVSAALVLPEDSDVELILRAQDVIHSVFIPAMRFKQDAVPGMSIHAHVRPIATGNYEIACAELCGTGHYRMRAPVRVLSQEQFAAWLNAQEKAKE